MTGRRPSPPPYLTLQENLYTFLRLAYISLYFLAALRQQTGSGAGCLKRSSPPSVKQAVMNTGPEEQVDVEGQANGNKGKQTQQSHDASYPQGRRVVLWKRCV